LSKSKKYGYWNNTDRPDEVSEEEWDQRSEDWDKALGDSAPAQVGFSYSCIGKHEIPPIGQLDYCEEFVKPVEERALRLAEDLLFDEFVKERKAENTDEDQDRTSYIFTLWRKFQDWKKDKGKTRFEEKKNEISAKLNPNLTKDDFLKKLQFKVEEEKVQK